MQNFRSQTYLISICILTRYQLVPMHINIEEALYFSMNTTVQGAFEAQACWNVKKKGFRNNINYCLPLFKTMENPHLENLLDPLQEIMELKKVWRMI